MGRHGGKKQRFNPLIIGLTVAALVLIVGLGWWWWSLRSATDPVSADPVQAYATVTDSGRCTTAGSTTTVDMNTSDGVVSATLKVCGYRVDQSILVEYLRSDPSQARVFGTSTAPESSVVQKLLPIAILLLGVIAAGAALAMLRERRKPRMKENPISVAELRASRLAQSSSAAGEVPPADLPPADLSPADHSADSIAPLDVAPAAEPTTIPETQEPTQSHRTEVSQADLAYAPADADDVAAQAVSLNKPTPAPSYQDDLFDSPKSSDHQDR